MGGVLEGDTFTNVLYENPGFGNNWITIVLRGVASNRDAIGTRLALRLDDGTTVYATVSSGGSFGASSMEQEIGIGKATRIEALTVDWPTGVRQVLEGIPANQKIVVTEGSDSVEVVKAGHIPFAAGLEPPSGNHHHQHHRH
jgi:hypothetical protein